MTGFSFRWFDKSFSLILTKDGKAAINFEHSWGDGVAVMRFFNEVYKDSTRKAAVHPGNDIRTDFDPSRHVRRLGINCSLLANFHSRLNSIRVISARISFYYSPLYSFHLDNVEFLVCVLFSEFHLSDGVKTAVDNARRSFEKTTSNFGVDLFTYEGLTKSFCKEKKVSPDAMMQLGFQLAYYQQNGTHCATYESCSTAAFKHGRTETIRPCTHLTKSFSTAANQTGDYKRLASLITECSNYHGQLTKEAAMGMASPFFTFSLSQIITYRNDGAEFNWICINLSEICSWLRTCVT